MFIYKSAITEVLIKLNCSIPQNHPLQYDIVNCWPLLEIVRSFELTKRVFQSLENILEKIKKYV
jgi:hypothetical protein